MWGSLFIFNYIRNITIKCGANTVQKVAVIAHDLIFIITVDNMKSNTCSFCQFISGNMIFIQILI